MGSTLVPYQPYKVEKIRHGNILEVDKFVHQKLADLNHRQSKLDCGSGGLSQALRIPSALLCRKLVTF